MLRPEAHVGCVQHAWTPVRPASVQHRERAPWGARRRGSPPYESRADIRTRSPGRRLHRRGRAAGAGTAGRAGGAAWGPVEFPAARAADSLPPSRARLRLGPRATDQPDGRGGSSVGQRSAGRGWRFRSRTVHVHGTRTLDLLPGRIAGRGTESRHGGQPGPQDLVPAGGAAPGRGRCRRARPAAGVVLLARVAHGRGRPRGNRPALEHALALDPDGLHGRLCACRGSAQRALA